MIKNKIVVLLMLILNSCGTLNYPSQNTLDVVIPVVATSLLQFMKYYPSAATYIDLINRKF